MNIGFLHNFPWFKSQSNMDLGPHLTKDLGPTLASVSTLIEPPKRKNSFNVGLWGWSLLSVIPWAMNSREKIRTPPTINRELKRRAQPRDIVEHGGAGTRVRFRPYVSKFPWHTGARAFLSQLFPRYGHYCGPNWSSGKNNGSNIWDKRPIDWLDFCCYCHDMGYETHDQAELLKADLAFLECLERPHMRTKGNTRIAHIYKTMCITGLNNILIPYRRHLLKLKSGQPLVDFGWLSNVKWRSWNSRKLEIIDR